LSSLKVILFIFILGSFSNARGDELKLNQNNLFLRDNLNWKKDIETYKLKLALDSLSKLNIPKKDSCEGEVEFNIASDIIKLDKNKNPIFKLPKKIGGELTLLNDPGLKDVIKLGFWSENFTTWNILKVDLYTAREERFKTDIKIGPSSAQTEMKYEFDLGDSNKIQIKAYNKFNHDMLRPKNIESGGRIGYGFKSGKMDFGFYLFAAHHQNLD
jgi:hypothetical protein